jgi:hypothetical protein
MKKLLCVLVILPILAALPALGDTIAPASVTANLNIGSSLTVHKTVTVSAGSPVTSEVDVYFLADTTGSMYYNNAAVQSAASSILAATAGLGDVEFAVGEYKDQPSTDGSSAYAYRLNTAMTSNEGAAQTGINMWGAYGGGDYPEADLFALQSLATGTTTGWRTGSAKILVWMGDAPGHDPSGGSTLATAEAALTGGQSSVIKTLAVNLGGLNDYGQASAITAATGGTLYSGINASSIVATISAAISSAFTHYSTVSLDLSGAGPGVSAASTPAIAGSFDRSVARTFDFDVTFTGVSPGTDAFSIYATVDGGRVATERDSITVGSGASVPEPGSILLFGTVLFGIAARMRRQRQ